MVGEIGRFEESRIQKVGIPLYIYIYFMYLFTYLCPYLFLDCESQCSYGWHRYYGNSFSCRNITSLLGIIKCAPVIIEKL